MRSQKIISATIALRKRWYDDACGTALALELVGGRWSLLIVRELMFGGRRFSDLRSGLPGVSVPCGFTKAGLPIGLQLLAAPFEEEKLLRVARMHERATDWHTRRPKLPAP